MAGEIIMAHHGELLRSSGASWWTVAGKTCLGAWQAKGAASQAASYANLANPGTYDLAAGVAPTWAAATGWTFNGTSQYLDSGWMPPHVYYAGTLICRFAGGSTSGVHAVCGCGRTSRVFGMRSAQLGKRTYLNGGYLQDDTALAAGTMAVAGNAAYLNGSAEAGTIGAGNVSSGLETLYIGAEPIAPDTPVSYYSGQIYAVALYSDILSAAEVSALTAAMAAL